MGGIGSGRKPRIVASIEPDPVPQELLLDDKDLDDKELQYFRLWGVKKLGYALVANSIRDILTVRSDPSAPPDQCRSASWLESDDGRQWLEFLIPSASAQSVISRIHEQPELVLRALINAVHDEERICRGNAQHQEDAGEGLSGECHEQLEEPNAQACDPLADVSKDAARLLAAEDQLQLLFQDDDEARDAVAPPAFERAMCG